MFTIVQQFTAYGLRGLPVPIGGEAKRIHDDWADKQAYPEGRNTKYRDVLAVVSDPRVHRRLHRGMYVTIAILVAIAVGIVILFFVL